MSLWIREDPFEGARQALYFKDSKIAVDVRGIEHGPHFKKTTKSVVKEDISGE